MRNDDSITPPVRQKGSKSDVRMLESKQTPLLANHTAKQSVRSRRFVDIAGSSLKGDAEESKQPSHVQASEEEKLMKSIQNSDLKNVSYHIQQCLDQSSRSPPL